MGFLESIFRAITEPKFNEELIYEQVYNELTNDQIRVGLWTKAIAESYGDESVAKSIYIKLRVESIKEELIAYEQEEYRKTKQLEIERKRKQVLADEARKIAEYKSTHTNVKCKFCGINQDVKNTEIQSKICKYCNHLISKAKHEYLFVYCQSCNNETLCSKESSIDNLLNLMCTRCSKYLYKKKLFSKSALAVWYFCESCDTKNSFNHDVELSTIACSKCGTKLYTSKNGKLMPNNIIANESVKKTSVVAKVVVDKDIKNRFVIMEDVVWDKSTNLRWTKNINTLGSTVNWTQAVSKYKTYNYYKMFGIDSWRIPNIDDFVPFKLLMNDLGHSNDGQYLLKTIGFINFDLPYYIWTDSGTVSLKSFDKIPSGKFNYLWLVSGPN